MMLLCWKISTQSARPVSVSLRAGCSGDTASGRELSRTATNRSQLRRLVLAIASMFQPLIRGSRSAWPTRPERIPTGIGSRRSARRRRRARIEHHRRQQGSTNRFDQCEASRRKRRRNQHAALIVDEVATTGLPIAHNSSIASEIHSLTEDITAKSMA